jgi:hypothetical protein
MVIKKMNMIKQIFGIVILMTLTSCSQTDKLNESEKELITEVSHLSMCE